LLVGTLSYNTLWITQCIAHYNRKYAAGNTIPKYTCYKHSLLNLY